MNNEEPKKLSEYLRTENGKKVIEAVRAEVNRLADKPCKEEASRFILLDQALFALDESCAGCKPGHEWWDMDVSDELFDEPVDNVVASILSWPFGCEQSWDIMCDGDACDEARRTIFWDYRA